MIPKSTLRDYYAWLTSRDGRDHHALATFDRFQMYLRNQMEKDKPNEKAVETDTKSEGDH